MAAPAGLVADAEVRLGSLHLRAALRVAAGETVAVVGPNGAGKTTLLRALAGLQPLADGRVCLDGVVLEAHGRPAVAVEERPVATVFQDLRLFPHLSALDNVAFGLRARGARRGPARAEAGRWLARLGLAEDAAARPGQLSGGQAQRVALARALATRPALLLLDEPLAALDATTRAATRTVLRQHLAGHGGAAVVVAHDPVDAGALADRVVVLEVGAVVQEGTLAELTGRPRSRYVADLVGVNLLAGEGDGEAGVAVGGLALAVADHRPGPVLASFPPRAVALSLERPRGTARNVWPAVVDGIDRAGHRCRVRARGPVTVVAEVTEAAVADLGLAEGSAVWVAVKATEVTVTPA